LKWIIILTEGTRDSIFLKLILEKHFNKSERPQFIESYVKSTVPSGGSETYETYISGAYIIHTTNYNILLVPLQGVSQLVKFYKSIKNDILDENKDDIHIPSLTKLETNRINKNDVDRIILVFDKDNGDEIIGSREDNLGNYKLSVQKESIGKKRIRIVKLIFNGNLEEFILEEMINKTNIEEIRKIKSIIDYLKKEGFSTSKAVKSALYVYCNNYKKQYTKLFNGTDQKTLEDTTNKIVKILLED